MIWNDYMTAVAERMREVEALANIRYAISIPYFIQTELQYFLYEALTQVLREIPNTDYEGFSSVAVQTLSTTVSSGYTGVGAIALPLNVARIIGVSVDGKPSVVASPGGFIQGMNMTGGRWTNRWTAMMGKVLFIGTNAKVTVLQEPTLAEWQAASTPVFPPGYDIRAIDVAHKRILIADYVPAWRP